MDCYRDAAIRAWRWLAFSRIISTSSMLGIYDLLEDAYERSYRDTSDLDMRRYWHEKFYPLVSSLIYVFMR